MSPVSLLSGASLPWAEPTGACCFLWTRQLGSSLVHCLMAGEDGILQKAYFQEQHLRGFEKQL